MSDRMYYSQEAEQRARRDKLMLILLTTGLSVTIGALIAMLFAPQTGDEFREQIGEQVGDTIAKGRKLAESASDRVAEQAGKLREEAQDRLMD